MAVAARFFGFLFRLLYPLQRDLGTCRNVQH